MHISAAQQEETRRAPSQESWITMRRYKTKFSWRNPQEIRDDGEFPTATPLFCLSSSPQLERRYSIPIQLYERIHLGHHKRRLPSRLSECQLNPSRWIRDGARGWRGGLEIVRAICTGCDGGQEWLASLWIGGFLDFRLDCEKERIVAMSGAKMRKCGRLLGMISW